MVRNSQRMSLRLYNKRRPLDPNASSGSPAVKRYLISMFLNLMLLLTCISDLTFLCSDMVWNKLCWDANDAEGLSKERKVSLDW